MFRSLLRFSIRDLFWLVLVVALAVGWYSNRGQFLSENERLRKQNLADAERSRMAAHNWWIDAIKGINDVDHLILLAKPAAEHPQPDYKLLSD